MGWIMTANGWRQLAPRANDIGQPARNGATRADGQFVSRIDPLEYNDCGRYIGPYPLVHDSAAFKRLLDPRVKLLT